MGETQSGIFQSNGNEQGSVWSGKNQPRKTFTMTTESDVIHW